MTSVSTTAFYDRASADMTALRAQADKLQSQISTGNRLSSGADDPLAASQMRQMARADALAKVDSASAQQATTNLTLADTGLSSFADTITQLQQLATQAASGTLSTAQRQSIGSQVNALHQQILDLANSRDSAGNALFGGQTTGQAYTLDASGNPVYGGTATAPSQALGDGQSVTSSVTGPEFLTFKVGGTPTDLLTVVKTLGDALTGTSGADPIAAAKSALDGLNAGLDAVTTAQTVVGARLNWVDLNTSRATTQGELRANTEASVGGTDVATTVTQLQQVMTVLQASQASFAKLSSLSLFDVIH